MRYYHEKRLGQSGQTISWAAPEGIPDADGTITITTSSGADADGDTWPATATLGTGASTVATAAAEGDVVIEVDTGDGALFAAGPYTIVTTTGRRFDVVVTDVDSDDLSLANPLRAAVPLGSVIASSTLTYALPDDLVATAARRLQCVWTYDVDGLECVHTETLTISRSPFVVSIDEADLRAHDPAIVEYTDRAGNWRHLIDGAGSDLYRRLAAKRLYPDLIRDRAGLRDALAYMVLEKYYRSIPSQSEIAGHWKRAAADALEEVASAQTWHDESEDGVLDTGELQRHTGYARVG